MSQKPIYLDYCATTPVDPRVIETMLPFFSDRFGNASSRTHVYGWDASEAVEMARESIGDLLGSHPREIYFTSGATESINLAIFGIARALRQKGNHIITCATEHQATLESCRELEARGYELSYLGVDGEGQINLDELKEAIGEKTILISLMAANNETGVLHPLPEIAQLARSRGILFLTDATQAIGKIPFHVEETGADLAAFSGHKIYGPKGIGALYVRKNSGINLPPILFGGGQEGGIRAGTLNVPGIAAMGKASEICREELQEEGRRAGMLRDKLEEGLAERIGNLVVNGQGSRRLPQVSNLSFTDIEGTQLIRALKGLAISQGSACHSAVIEPSHVLKAMGLTDERALSSLRISLGRFTTGEEIESAIGMITDAVKKLSLHYEQRN